MRDDELADMLACAQGAEGFQHVVKPEGLQWEDRLDMTCVEQFKKLVKKTKDNAVSASRIQNESKGDLPLKLFAILV